MPPLALLDESNFVVCGQDSFVWIYDLNNLTEEPYQLPLQKCNDKKVDFEAKGAVLAADFSPSGAYFVICNDYKQLLLYRTNRGPGRTWELLSSRDSPKKAVKVMFLEDESRVLMADKFGDVTSYSCLTPESEGEVILGHLSTLMDFTMLHNNTLIATADRDEKIRVSKYPNTYNIESFCLGHTSFVTSVIEVGSHLASSSGDGSVRLWNSLNGEELSNLKCGVAGQFIHQMIYVNEKGLIYATVAEKPKLLKISTKNNELKLLDVKELPAPALWMCKRNNTVLLLLDDKTCPLHIISNPEDSDSNLNESIDPIRNDLTNKWSSFENSSKQLSEYYISLIKMNMENIDEQMERKGKRPSSHLDKSEPEAKKPPQSVA